MGAFGDLVGGTDRCQQPPELGATPNQVMVAWLVGGDPPIIPIAGVSTLAQLEELLPAADLRLDGTLRERLDTAV